MATTGVPSAFLPRAKLWTPQEGQKRCAMLCRLNLYFERGADGVFRSNFSGGMKVRRKPFREQCEQLQEMTGA